jgi:hypothetical protein
MSKHWQLIGTLVFGMATVAQPVYARDITTVPGPVGDVSKDNTSSNNQTKATSGDAPQEEKMALPKRPAPASKPKFRPGKELNSTL